MSSTEQITIPLVQKELRVTRHLIKCDQVSYQIRNIVATAVVQKDVLIRVAEPTVMPLRTGTGLGGALSVGAIAGGFCWALLSASAPTAGIAVGVAVFACVGTLLRKKFGVDNQRWNEAAQKTRQLHRRWTSLSGKKVALFGLVIETNSGSTPIFYSTQRQDIERANDAVNGAMSDSDDNEKSLLIRVIDAPYRHDGQSVDTAIEAFASAIGHDFVHRD